MEVRKLQVNDSSRKTFDDPAYSSTGAMPVVPVPATAPRMYRVVTGFVIVDVVVDADVDVSGGNVLVAFKKCDEHLTRANDSVAKFNKHLAEQSTHLKVVIHDPGRQLT